jgi:hypothetical protein
MITHLIAPSGVVRHVGTNAAEARVSLTNAPALPSAVGSRSINDSLSVVESVISAYSASDTRPTADQHLISAAPGRLYSVVCRFETGGPSRYIVVLDAALLPGTANQWIGPPIPITLAAGLVTYTWDKGLPCANGCVIGIASTEPGGATLLTLSADTFILHDFAFAAN